MMSATSGSFCVVCGATGTPLVGAVCPDCLGKKGQLVSIPERVVVITCPRCGARNVGKHWERGPPPGLFRGEDIDRHLKVEPPAILRKAQWTESEQRRPLGPGVRVFYGDIELELAGAPVRARLSTEVKDVHHSCPQCSRREGGYYTAILQFRPAPDARPRRSMEDFKNASHALWLEFIRNAPRSWREALGWEEELKEGWDVYMMETSIAKTIAKSLKQISGATTKESASLWGVRDGRKTYRVTFLLRFPAVMTGDVFEREGELLRVTGRDDTKLKCMSSTGPSPQMIEGTTLVESWRLIGGRDRIATGVISSLSPPKVLDPETGDTLGVSGPLPPGVEKGQEVPILIDGEKAWIAPATFQRNRSR